MRYVARIGARAFQIDIGPQERFLIDGAAVNADVGEVVRGVQWRVRLDGEVHEVTIVRERPLRLSVDGVEVSADVVDERQAIVGGARAVPTSGRHELRAPMPGLLKALHVAEGDVVEAGQAIATLEAMKMENELRAPARARVSRLPAATGTKVEGGAVLAVLVMVET